MRMMGNNEWPEGAQQGSRAAALPPRDPTPRTAVHSDMHRSMLLVLAAIVALSACIDRDTARKAIEGVEAEGGVVPDDMPVMLNREPPFRYPPALYASKIQGNVTLHIHIDSSGAIWPDSTSVVQSSGYPGLDSAAVEGSRALHFAPARLHGHPVAVSLMLPVFFRHPQARPLPGDTVLHLHTPAPHTP